MCIPINMVETSMCQSMILSIRKIILEIRNHSYQQRLKDLEQSSYEVPLVAALCMLYKVNLNLNPSLFNELPSASVRVRHTRAAAAAHPLEFDVSRCGTSQFARCFLPAQTRVGNDLPYTVFHTGMLDGCNGAVNRWLLPRVCFSVFLWGCASNL